MKRSFLKDFLAILLIFMMACYLGGCGGSGGTASNPGPAINISPPSNITADAGNLRVTLNWTPVTEAVSFNIYYSTTQGVTKTAFDTAIRDIHGSYAVTGLINGTKYYFVITAINASGQESDVSKEVSATPTTTPTPAAPKNVTAAATGSGTVRVTWSASTGATSYTVYYGPVPNMTPATAAFSKTNAVSPQDITGLTNNTTYYFTVTATNAAINPNGESVTSFEVNCVPLASLPPSAPGNVTAAEGNAQATISWDPVSGATSYNIYYATDMFVSKTFGTKITVGSTVSYTLTSLLNKVAYFFVVTAVNANGESAESAQVSATPLAAKPVSAMMPIPAGDFQMGDNLDGVTYAMPVHIVTISDFYIDKYETTYDLWKTVYDWAVDPARGAPVYSFDHPGNNGSNNIGTNMPVTVVSWYDVLKWLNARSEKESKTPVYYTDATTQTTVTVYRTGQVDVANSMVKWDANGYRLPTEAEWEKAARGGLVGQRYPWGNVLDASNANYNMGRAVSVGLYLSNGYGLYDMVGNVFEWTWDWGTSADGYANWAAWGDTDPHGPDSSSTNTKVRRGGAYAEGSKYLACYERVFRTQTYAAPYFGFRSASK